MRPKFFVLAATAMLAVSTGEVSGQRIYWALESSFGVFRSCLNGNQVERLVERALGTPYDVAIDAVNGKLYWSSAFSAIGWIRKANLDGTQVETVIASSAASPNSIALDLPGGKLYWTDDRESSILRSNLDGTGPEHLVSNPNLISRPGSIALDLMNRRVYWIEHSAPSIRRIGFDGSGYAILVSRLDDPAFTPREIALDPERGHLYWTQDAIHRADLDGKNRELFLSVDARHIAVDSHDLRMFWWGNEGLGTVRLDGTDEKSLDTRAAPDSMALDLTPCAPGPDCQMNNVPDACDICSGTSTDCNSNGVPDECEHELICPGQGRVCEVEQLRSPTSESGDFGSALVLTEDRLAVGAFHLTVQGVPLAGAVFFFDRSTGHATEPHILMASTPAAYKRFGASLAYGDNRLAVGSPGGGTVRGAVHMFLRSQNGWSEQAVLTSSETGDGFGSELLFFQDNLLVAAPSRGAADGLVTGAVDVFENTPVGWNHSGVLTGITGAFTGFGRSLAADADTAVVGAPFEDDPLTNAGAVYVFRRLPGGWMPEARLTAPVPQFGAEFGHRVAILGDLMLIAAPREDAAGNDSGAVHVFLRTNGRWEWSTVLTPPGGNGAYFGTALALSGNQLLVGQDNHNVPDDLPGTIHWYRKGGAGWIRQAQFPAQSALTLYGFPRSLALQGDRAAASGSSFALLFALDGSDCNSDRIYDACDDDCNGNLNSDVCDIFQGTSLDELPIQGDATPDECQNDCNENGRPDLEDIVNLVSRDCNKNNRPDECELAEGISTDCDGNGILDECGQFLDCNDNLVADKCDIISGFSFDLDNNSVPDECAPVNDACANAVVVSTGRYDFDLLGAGVETPSWLYECDIIAEAPVVFNDVWYTLTPECSASVTITTQTNGAYAPLVVVYQGGCPPDDSPSAIACTGWIWGGNVTTFSAIAGQEYVVRLGNARFSGKIAFALQPSCRAGGDGDVDRDGDVDIDDYADWNGCFTGPAQPAGTPYDDHCRAFDYNSDGAVDLRDAHLFFNDLQFTSGVTRFVPQEYLTIQSAIDAAGQYDTVLVAPGTYRENLNLHGKPIHLVTKDAFRKHRLSATVIDGGGLGPVITLSGSERPSTLIAGFTLTNGSATRGGGVSANGASAQIIHCRVLGNRALDGAGIACSNGRILDSLIQQNVAGDSGGGLYDCDGIIRGCNISRNSARRGGGLFGCDGRVEFSRILNNDAAVSGGGFASCDALIAACVVSANYSGHSGGGFGACHGAIRSCVVSGNQAVHSGGACFNSFAALTNNTIVGNRTVHSLGRGEALAFCMGLIRSCIFQQNGHPYAVQSSRPAYSVVPAGSILGSANMYLNALFQLDGHWTESGKWIDGDYRLQADSPCIDSGDPTVAPGEFPVDVEGHPRVQNGRVDMGAYESSDESR